MKSKVGVEALLKQHAMDCLLSLFECKIRM